MEEMDVNVEHDKPVDSRSLNNQTGRRSSERRFHGVIFLSLGLLSVFLLVGLIIGVQHHQQLSSLTEERDLLNSSLAQVTKELNRLQSKICPVGWWMFGDSCYFLSGGSGSWNKGRKDCKDRGADLVVINSLEEQTSLVKLTKKYTWIGLSDRDKKGTWKWVDGTPLTLKFWGTHEPKDAGGKEDCAQISSSSSWKERSCETSLRWICEKTA